MSPTGPSHAVGVRVDDGVHAINGVDCSNKGNPEIVKLIQASGNKVTMLLGDPQLPPLSPEHLPTDRSEATPEGKDSRPESSRSEKLTSVLKRIPRTTEPSTPESKNTSSSKTSIEKKKVKTSTKSSSKKSSDGSGSKKTTPKKAWNGASNKSGGPATDLFSYVSPLNRGIKYDNSKKQDKQDKPFWERAPAPQPKSLSEARRKVKESRDTLSAKVEKQKQKSKEKNPQQQQSAKDFIRQQRAARRKQRLLDSNEMFPTQAEDCDLILPLSAADVINVPKTPSPIPGARSTTRVGPNNLPVIMPPEPETPATAVPVSAGPTSPVKLSTQGSPGQQPTQKAAQKSPKKLTTTDSDGLTWEYVEKMANTLDAQLKAARSECEAASRERDELLQKLLSMTDSYDQLLQSKEAEAGRWSKTVEKIRLDAERAKAAHATTQEDLERNYQMRLQSTLADAERRLQRAHSNKTTGREAELQKEVASLSTMISALEDTLKAKDELLDLKEKSRATELEQIESDHQEELSNREEEIASSSRLEVEALTDRLAMIEHEHEAEKQRILAEKQAEMDAALASCQEAILSMDGGGGVQHGPAVDSLLAQMRDALAAKEEEKAAALRRKDAELVKAVQKHEATLTLALAKKDREINTAMELAQYVYLALSGVPCALDTHSLP